MTRAVVIMAEAKTPTSGARQCVKENLCAERTVWNWLKLPIFAAALDAEVERLNREVRRQVRNIFRRNAAAVAEAMVERAQDLDAGAAQRAGEKILDGIGAGTDGGVEAVQEATGMSFMDFIGAAIKNGASVSITGPNTETTAPSSAGNGNGNSEDDPLSIRTGVEVGRIEDRS